MNLTTQQDSATLDPERQAKAREYARISRRLMAVDLVLSALYAFAWLVFGWSAALRGALGAAIATPALLVLAYALAFGGIYFLIDLPLSFYSDFTLPHRYGQSTETLRGWAMDQLKGLGISALFGAAALEVLYVVLHSFPETWWLWAAGLLLLFNVVMANLAPVVLMPLFNKFVPLSDEYHELAQRLTRLAERSGTHVQGVYQFDMSRRTKSANAALTGLGSTRRIILGDTLLKEFTPEEIETVMAHELGHQVNKDIPFLIAANTVTTVAGLYLASLGLKWGAARLGFAGPADVAALPLFLLVMGAFGLVTLPLSNALTRWRERMADRYALESTRDPRSFISAMTRLANQNLADVDPEPWVEFLLHSHPSLKKRITMAQAFAKNAAISLN
jgi:STE24 endopeptidase